MFDKKKYYYYFLGMLISFTVFRLWLAVHLGLGDDEAYYWEWSRRLDLGYFDHPSMISYVIYFFTSILGKTELAVRLGSIVFFTATTYLVYKISFEMFMDEQKAFYSALLLNITPVFSAGAFMAFPDTPLGLFWVLSLFILYKITITNKAWLWYLEGILTGLGLLSKYTAVLLPVSILFFLICSEEHRFWLKRKEPYLACVLALVIFFPIVIWNMNNHWASFGFQFTHGVSNKVSSFSFKNLTFLIVSQLLYISPLVFIFSFYAMYWTWKKGFKKKTIIIFYFPVLQYRQWPFLIF